MPKHLLFEIRKETHQPGLRVLRPTRKIALAPGEYQARVRRWGVGDPVIVGRSDDLSFGLKIGPALIGATGEMHSANRIDMTISSLPSRFSLDTGASLPLTASLVVDRGKKPAALKKIVDKILGELPAKDAEALLDVVLKSGVNAAFGLSLASALFVRLAGTVIDSLFGKHALIEIDDAKVVAKPGGRRQIDICVAQLPDFSGINVGYRPTYERDFGIRADDGMLYETIRDRSDYPESHTFRGWSRAQEPYVTIAIEPV